MVRQGDLWMIDVLTDLLRVAQDRGLDNMAAQIVTTIQVGRQEIQQQAQDKGETAGAGAQDDHASARGSRRITGDGNDGDAG
ncbi:hypothetical protein [Pseudooceanicola sp. HF7]|uniref:hypothetical protein n=1 Tax=Pseudooceanicola sp. HF7 TaxID=2721560 RepID=UPI001C379670|nr:hypothetical protein [Pseudooceanicola sp. HF7]